jgi:hypothetical protein
MMFLRFVRVSGLVGVATLVGCYDQCDHIGDARCDGSEVMICGNYSTKFPEWDDVADCSVYSAQCLVDGPVRYLDSYCAFPELVCDRPNAALCYGEILVACEASGAPARFLMRCDRCLENGNVSLCAPPAHDAGQ